MKSVSQREESKSECDKKEEQRENNEWRQIGNREELSIWERMTQQLHEEELMATVIIECLEDRTYPRFTKNVMDVEEYFSTGRTFE